MKRIAMGLMLASLVAGAASEKPTITVGSKRFTESYILAEIVAQIIEEVGEARAVRRFGLGQTGIAFEGLKSGQIDLYPEYSGTIAEAILKRPELKSLKEIKASLKPLGLTLSRSLGFNNTYALAVRESMARDLHLKSISDLKAHPQIKVGLSHEFLERKDGYPKLRERYGLNFKNVRGLDHGLSYEALDRGEIDVTDIYSTDAKLAKFHLVLLRDDRKAFPDYLAVLFAKQSLEARAPKTWNRLRQLEGALSEEKMVRLNAMAELESKSFSEIAQVYLHKVPRTKSKESVLGPVLWKLTQQHLYLVGISLLASILVGVPLAVIARESALLGQAILILSGLFQTIPSLALLCFLIPFIGIGNAPALFALFLYGLLPIVRGTYIALTTLDPKLYEVSRALGLSYWQRLWYIELPISSPSLLSGIRTAAIINVGTATLAALIGAGGYGVPIMTGLALNDMSTILQGAIPAALMAIAVHGVFEVLDRLIIPKGIR